MDYQFDDLFSHYLKQSIMKKYFFTILSFVSLQTALAQYHLSGTGYVQSFNALGAGLPEGWDITSNATDTTLGTSSAASFLATPAANTRWGNSTGAFKNVASANGFATFAAATNALQLAATDRALAVKQTATLGDPGAAFTFCIDNTFGLSNFKLEFKIQSLDSSAGGRMTAWQVQYALGDSPKVFNTVSAFPTGGYTYSNFPINISFASALDDKREKVWIRVMAVRASTGSSSRTTTAIDDVSLHWDGVAYPSYRPLLQTMYPANGATDVPLGSVLSLDFSKQISIGSTGNIYIKNEAKGTTQTINALSSFLAASGKRLSIAGAKLDPATTYHVTFDSGIVDTALAATPALIDTMEWRFTTLSSMPHFLVEYFDTACAKSNSLPSGWTKFSATGVEEWNCIEHASGNSSIRMFGNDGTANTINEDWLISPRMDLRSPDALGVSFYMLRSNSGEELQVMASQNYAGSGSPDSASWTAVSIPTTAAGLGKWMRYDFSIAAFKSQPFQIAFKYSSNASGAYDIQIDSFMTMIKTGIPQVASGNNELKVIGYSSSNNIALQISNVSAGNYQLELYNAFGQIVYKKEVMLFSGTQAISINDIDLASGLYIVKLANNDSQFLQKCIVR